MIFTFKQSIVRGPFTCASQHFKLQKIVKMLWKNDDFSQREKNILITLMLSFKHLNYDEWMQQSFYFVRSINHFKEKSYSRARVKDILILTPVYQSLKDHVRHIRLFLLYIFKSFSAVPKQKKNVRGKILKYVFNPFQNPVIMK